MMPSRRLSEQPVHVGWSRGRGGGWGFVTLFNSQELGTSLLRSWGAAGLGLGLRTPGRKGPLLSAR